MAGRTADECDAGLKAEAPVARRAADVKRVDRGAIVLLNWLLNDAYCREEIKKMGNGRRLTGASACWSFGLVEEEVADVSVGLAICKYILNLLELGVC